LIYVSASHLEGTSPSLLSALGAKVCCLVNGIEENLHTVDNSAITYRKNDNNHLVSQWQKLIDNPELIKEMSEKGYLRVSKYFSWESISKNYLDLFSEL
jgi:glycosyltransferase involved in cell wall biosynthesis